MYIYEVYRLARIQAAELADEKAEALAWQAAERWCQGVGWRCAMRLYARYIGEWSEYHQGYHWWPLSGAAHRAIDDCRAVLSLLRDIAADTSLEALRANKEQASDDPSDG